MPNDSSKNQASNVDISELRKKAEAGDSSAAFELGHAYDTGRGVRQNFQQAAFWYRKGADGGNAAAQRSLGVLYWFGEGVEKDKAEAVKWYHKAAKQGDANAMFDLGAAYYNGEGVNVDDTLAYAWFMLSRDAGSQAGRDAAKRSEAEHGERDFSSACVEIGKMYEQGSELPKDVHLATDWYKKAAQGEPSQSRSEAETRLAEIYLDADNYREALPWCVALAKEGRPGGAFCLGHIYQNGLGVNQDLKEAFRWYERGAVGGSGASMLALGRMYEDGQGTKANRVEAMVWLIRASLARNTALPEARKLRASLNDREWRATRDKLKKSNFDPDRIDAFLKEGVGQPAH